jgi:hypothetical protein
MTLFENNILLFVLIALLAACTPHARDSHRILLFNTMLMCAYFFIMLEYGHMLASRIYAVGAAGRFSQMLMSRDTSPNFSFIRIICASCIVMIGAFLMFETGDGFSGNLCVCCRSFW